MTDLPTAAVSNHQSITVNTDVLHVCDDAALLITKILKFITFMSFSVRDQPVKDHVEKKTKGSRRLAAASS